MSNQTGQKKPRLLILDCSLRLSLIPISIASLWLTVTNHENNIDYGNIRFANFMGLKYMNMACTSSLGVGYALVSLICNWVRCLVNKSWVFFVSDQVMAYLLVTSGSAVMEILYLAYKGDRPAHDDCFYLLDSFSLLSFYTSFKLFVTRVLI